jgi:hypothetical protein
MVIKRQDELIGVMQRALVSNGRTPNEAELTDRKYSFSQYNDEEEKILAHIVDLFFDRSQVIIKAILKKTVPMQIR